MRGWFTVYRFLGVTCAMFGIVRFIANIYKKPTNFSTALAFSIFFAMYDVVNTVRKDSLSTMSLQILHNSSIEVTTVNREYGQQRYIIPKENISYLSRTASSSNYTEIHLKDTSVFRGVCPLDQVERVLQVL